jgi:hypothetical protein
LPKLCVSCGSQLDDRDRFCIRCGAPQLVPAGQRTTLAAQPGTSYSETGKVPAQVETREARATLEGEIKRLEDRRKDQFRQIEEDFSSERKRLTDETLQLEELKQRLADEAQRIRTVLEKEREQARNLVTMPPTAMGTSEPGQNVSGSPRLTQTTLPPALPGTPWATAAPTPQLGRPLGVTLLSIYYILSALGAIVGLATLGLIIGGLGVGPYVPGVVTTLYSYSGALAYVLAAIAVVIPVVLVYGLLTARNWARIVVRILAVLGIVSVITFLGFSVYVISKLLSAGPLANDVMAVIYAVLIVGAAIGIALPAIIFRYTGLPHVRAYFASRQVFPQPRPAVTVPPGSLPAGAFCINCGTKLNVDSKFCPKCGQPKG